MFNPFSQSNTMSVSQYVFCSQTPPKRLKGLSSNFQMILGEKFRIRLIFRKNRNLLLIYQCTPQCHNFSLICTYLHDTTLQQCEFIKAQPLIHFLNFKVQENSIKGDELKGYSCNSNKIINTSGFATTHVVVSVRHPITY